MPERDREEWKKYPWSHNSFHGVALCYAKKAVADTKKAVCRRIFLRFALDKRRKIVYDNRGCKAKTLYREERTDEKQYLPYVHAV